MENCDAFTEVVIVGSVKIAFKGRLKSSNVSPRINALIGPPS